MNFHRKKKDTGFGGIRMAYKQTKKQREYQKAKSVYWAKQRIKANVKQLKKDIKYLLGK